MERASGIGSAETAKSDRCVWAGGGQVVSVGKRPVGGAWKFLFLGFWTGFLEMKSLEKLDSLTLWVGMLQTCRH